MSKTMNKKTLKALQGSIKKWEKIVKGTGEDLGGKNCPLCRLYSDSCGECPICQATGQIGCSGTPYDEWRAHHYVTHESYIDYRGFLKIQCIACKELAEKELAFLRSLLPTK